MSLRERIAVILFLIFCIYAGFEYAACNWLIYPIFEQQEQQQAQNQTEAARKVILGEFSDLQHAIASEARGGSLYQAMKDRSRPFGSLDNRVDFVVLYDYRWNLMREQIPAFTTSDSLQQTLLLGESPFLCSVQMGFSKNGIVELDGGHAYIVAEPILSSPKSTQIQGMVAAGQFLTDKRIQAMRRRHHLDFNWSLITTEEQRTRNAAVVSQISSETPFCLTPVSDQLIECSTAFFDTRNQPALLIKTFHDKTITAHGETLIDRLLLAKLITGFAAILFLTGLFQIVIIKPIRKLIQHFSKFGHPGCVGKKIAFSRNDEIGRLGTEFDRMCERLQNAQIKLMEKSYVSGAAEMSSGILHNVRNALSPITTQIERIKDQFQDIPLQNLEQAQLELQTGSLSPDRREDLMRFVELTFQHVLSNLKEMLDGLQELSGQVLQIEDMLNCRRTFGGQASRHVELVEPAQLLARALEIIPKKFREKNRIQIHTGIRKLPPIPVAPTTFIQILQNLLINAAESIEREEPLCPKILIACSVEPHDPVEMLHWTIQDNGIGIEADKTETIFERGASSKNHGMTGIGLHWCANTINAMQGRLWAESRGPHQGACFHLLVPMAAEESLAAAGAEAGAQKG